MAIAASHLVPGGVYVYNGHDKKYAYIVLSVARVNDGLEVVLLSDNGVKTYAVYNDEPWLSRWLSRFTMLQDPDAW